MHNYTGGGVRDRDSSLDGGNYCIADWDAPSSQQYYTTQQQHAGEIFSENLFDDEYNQGPFE